MSQKEMKRLHVIHKVGEGLLTEKQAAEIISLSERQIRRIVKRIRDEGDKGIRHRSRGKESNRRLPKKLVERVTRLYQERYQGFGPTLKDKWGQVFTLDISSFPINLLIVE